MTRYSLIKLHNEVSNPKFPRTPSPTERHEALTVDTFAGPDFVIERDGDDVVVTGKARAVVLPWSGVKYAEVEPPTETPVKAVAAGKSRGGK